MVCGLPALFAPVILDAGSEALLNDLLAMGVDTQLREWDSVIRDTKNDYPCWAKILDQLGSWHSDRIGPQWPVWELNWSQNTNGSVFVMCHRSWPTGLDPDTLFCVKHQRTVANDNTVAFSGHRFQIPADRYRGNYARCRVEVHQHLNGQLSTWYQGRRLVCIDPAEIARPK